MNGALCFFHFDFVSSFIVEKRVHLNWLKIQSASFSVAHPRPDMAGASLKAKRLTMLQRTRSHDTMEWKALFFCWPKQSKYKEKNQQAPQKICLHNAIQAIIHGYDVSCVNKLCGNINGECWCLTLFNCCLFMNFNRFVTTPDALVCTGYCRYHRVDTQKSHISNSDAKGLE